MAKSSNLTGAFRALIELNAARELQYRANFVASSLGAAFWLLMAVFTVSIFYEHTSVVGGWSFWETAVLLGVFNALVGVVEGWLRPGIGSLPDEVRHGSLDLLLLRPIDTQLYLSFRELDLWRVTDVIAGFALSIYAMHRLGRTISIAELSVFLVMFAAAIAILYGVWLTLMSLAFWFVAVENLSTVFDALFEAARYPASAYPTALRVVFLFILPVAWTTTIPAAALVGRLSPVTAAACLVVAAIALGVSRAVWRVALRRYTSAGG
ncbi:MAG TPA: ABC-2 family transporter protein [Gemmatimonadaceae bacterium]|nr:ABC-2 family transporter protein [Gemmatimonadaceae bacterium]